MRWHTIRKMASILIYSLGSIAGALILVLTFWQPALWAEQRLTDIRMAFFSPTFPSRDKIVIVGISEEELSKYPYRSPVSRQLLADLLSQTASKGAKAIGIDFLFDQPTDPDKDSQLSNAIRQVRIPLVASYSSTLTGVQKTYVDNFVPASDLGNVDILVDPVAGAVRWTYPKVRLQDGKESFSFAGLLAHKTGVNVPSGKVAIMWNSNEPAFPQIPVDLVRFLPPNFLRSKIVLIGLMTSDHAHVTPLSVMGGGPRVPDVEVQAEALATLLGNAASPDISHWSFIVMSMLGGITGCFVASFFVESVWARAAYLFSAVIFFYILGFFAWYEYQIMLPIALPVLCLLLAGFTFNPLRQSIKAHVR